MCFCMYNILSGYKIGYSSTGSIKIGMCRYWCNARRGIYIYIYRYVHIMILYCMVPYGTILYMLYGTVRYYTLYIYTIWYRTVLCILIRYGTVRYYAEVRILACTVVLYIQ